MRVIAGEYKGRKLKAVNGLNTRPTSDKVKESVFHMLGPYFEGGRCIDLFAGSGSLGIEALSRGMEKAVFIDRSAQAIQTIKANIEMLHSHHQVEIYKNDTRSIIRLLEKKEERFNLILIDPPYDKIDINTFLKNIISSPIIADDALIYVEYRKSNPLEDMEGWTVIKEKSFNQTTKMSILEKDNK